jgi:hypothetical protein
MRSHNHVCTFLEMSVNDSPVPVTISDRLRI